MSKFKVGDRVKNAERGTPCFTVGKIYEYNNGIVYTDKDDIPYNSGNPTLDRKDALNRINVKFIELVED